MSAIKAAIQYWHSCLREEDHHEHSLTLRSLKGATSKPVLNPWSNDAVIFRSIDKFEPGSVQKKSVVKVFGLAMTAKSQGMATLYGYPLLVYKNKENMTAVTPLLFLKLELENSGVKKTDHDLTPILNQQAFQHLGLRDSEINILNETLIAILAGNGSAKDKLNQFIESIKIEAPVKLVEPLDPGNLSEQLFEADSDEGIYNSSILYNSEESPFNRAVLKDLEALSSANDLDQTSLRYLNDMTNVAKDISIVPILPFPANEVQISGVFEVLKNDFTVVTGPPGTGKSQFISNLMVNIIAQGQSVLFVSHTNDAVNVINERINSAFPSLVLRSGNKEIRQTLREQFNVLLHNTRAEQAGAVTLTQLTEDWSKIAELRGLLLQIFERERNIEYLEKQIKTIAELFLVDFRDTCIRYEKLEGPLSPVYTAICTLDGKAKSRSSMNFFEKLIASLLPKHFDKKITSKLASMNKAMPAELLLSLRRGRDSEQIASTSDPAFENFKYFLDLVRIARELKKENLWLDSQLPKEAIQLKIKDAEQSYFRDSHKYLDRNYKSLVLGDGTHNGAAQSFISEVMSGKKYSFRASQATKSLKAWACTLKSLHGTFPLVPNLFDYVIFDEASQVDLPSAAPALYRAKKMVVVGDANQLIHIARIPKRRDMELATKSGVTQFEQLFPKKTQYSTISLFRSAADGLKDHPVFLANHYRSQDQIIGLCNRVFYNKALKVNSLPNPHWPNGMDVGLHWLDCKGVTGQPSTGSRNNTFEAQMVTEAVCDTIAKLKGHKCTIGIATPFSAQKTLIYELLEKKLKPEDMEYYGLTVRTVHKFQGSESDIMFFSGVLAQNGKGNNDNWFNKNPEILNVALSRAKSLQYIVGDKAYYHTRKGVLGKIANAYDEIKNEQSSEYYSLGEKFDSSYERVLYERLAQEKFHTLGFKLIPKVVEQRYTLDLALVGPVKINIECDGYQHFSIGGVLIVDDIERDKFLKKKGWQVLRVANRRINNDIESVIRDIYVILEKASKAS